MTILHLATFDAHGGAAVAALRLVESQRRRGHDARMLVREKSTSTPHVEALTGAGGAPAVPRTDATLAELAWLFTQRARSPKSDTLFSSDLPTYDLASHPGVRAADVLHLHWVAGFLSSYELGRLQRLRKPIVWTLHDQWAFTGGCHYSQRCRGYTRTCAHCPQLSREAEKLAAVTLAQKREFIETAEIALAAPSRWLANAARESVLFRRARIDVVPYGIDVAARRLMSRTAAREALGLPQDAVVVFASSFNRREARKGDRHFLDALEQLGRGRPKAAGPSRALVVLTAGAGDTAPHVAGFPVRSMGPLEADDPRLAMAYRAADLFVLPSLEDNLPNTLLEAMAAGIPVVAYRTGGIPDALADNVNGRLVPKGNVGALAGAIRTLVADEPLRARLGAAAADTADTTFDESIQVAAYDRIYARERASILASTRHAPRRSAGRAARPNGAPHDAPGVARLVHDRSASRVFASLACREIAELREVVTARGGEIRELTAAVAYGDRERAREVAELQDVVAARGGEIRELTAAVAYGDRERTREAAELQNVVAARGGEIRELRAEIAGLEQTLAAETATAARRRDVLTRLMGVPGAHRARLVIGIFGVGQHGRRVLETVTLLDDTVAWFADNNPDRHGGTQLGVDVIAPQRIPDMASDAIVIASGQRAAILAQLVALGVPADRILTPDLSRTDADLGGELATLLDERRARLAR